MEIRVGEAYSNAVHSKKDDPALADLVETERETIAEISGAFGEFSARRLSFLTRSANAPWTEVFLNGEGEFKDIPHCLIEARFIELIHDAKAGTCNPRPANPGPLARRAP